MLRKVLAVFAASARRLRAAALLPVAALSVIACSASGPPATNPTSPPRPPLSAAELRRLVEGVAAVRGLPERSLIPIDRLSERDFAAVLRTGESQQSPEGLTQATGFLLAFNLASEATATRAAPMNDVLREQIIGFYDRRLARIFVRDASDPAADGSSAEKERIVLAHEVQHALQAQHFPAPYGGPDVLLQGEDARLAELALLEGDAMVTSVAYIGSEQGVPVRRILRAVADQGRAGAPEDMIRHDPRSRALGSALPIHRERLLFPYQAGMSFMGDLYRTGGFPLMNLAFQRPPVSTEQILHPQIYLNGEPPVEVRFPAAPPGYQILGAERLGELQTRAILAQCLDAASAARAAEGWGGDAFSVAAAPDHSIALLWSTAWDTPEDAAEFELALRSRPACWSAASLGGTGGLRIAGDHRVIRDGVKVAFVRGLPEPLLTQVASGLLSLPGPRPPNVVASPYRVRSSRPVPPRVPGRIASGVYSSPWLGVAAALPSDLRASMAKPDIELQLEHPGAVVAGIFTLSNRIATPAWNERGFNEIAAAFSRGLENRLLTPVAGGPTNGPLGPGIERTWTVQGTLVAVRVVIIPICEGAGSFVFAQAYSDPRARYVLDWWLGSFRWVSAGPPPVCDMLNPP